MSAFTLAEALGVRVVAVPELGRQAQFLPESRVLVIDADLSEEVKVGVMDMLLPSLFDEDADE